MKTPESRCLEKTTTSKKPIIMKKPIVLFFALLLTATTTMLAQIKEGDVIFDYKTSFDSGEELTLNGTGMREMLFIDLYAGGLYLKKRSNDAMGIASAKEDMAIKIKVVSKFVTQQKMIDAVYTGFDKATYGNTDPLRARIEVFISFFSEPIVKGDVFDIVYVEGKGSQCYKNGALLGTIEGQDFKFALFKIWLGEKPASKSLKKGMLGI